MLILRTYTLFALSSVVLVVALRRICKCISICLESVTQHGLIHHIRVEGVVIYATILTSY